MITRKLATKYAKDPAAFRNDLIIDVNGLATPFSKAMDDWQRADFAALDPMLKRCNGRSNDSPQETRAWLERARGHSKSTDIGVSVVWALAFANRPIRGYCFAADRDQAAIIKDAMATIIRLNPWLAEILEIQNRGVSNKAPGHPGNGSLLEISTSDVGSSYGILPDLIVADEVCHWTGDGSLWTSLISSAAKRSGCALIAITNAGFVDSWQWKVREAARTDKGWYFSRLDGPVASWMTDKRLEEQRRMLPEVAFARLWKNIWSSGGGDALTPQDIAAAFRDDLKPMTGSEPGYKFVAGADLGIKRDCSAVVTLAIGNEDTPYRGRFRLADHRVWKPTPGKKIRIQDVEDYIRELDEKFDLEHVVFDPWQAEHLAQRLEYEKKSRSDKKFGFYDEDPFMVELPPTSSNLRDIASLVIESFTDRRLLLYPCDELRTDLTRLRVEEKSYGFRLTSPRDEAGHGDTATAFCLALLKGHAIAGKKLPEAGDLFAMSGLSPYEEALRRFQVECRLHAEDMEGCGKPEDFNDGIRELFKLLGR